ncbi:DUF924 family protein [Roseovarius sp. D22-M7]|uniref:DUF924 family protein n=1 Tax=Roseovarius sp. D22-M7 TaxID=3127116 RepID=UPI0030105E04
MVSPDEVLKFWLDDVGPDGWYKSSEELDRTMRDQFEDDWENARAGACSLWLTYPAGTLAYIILTDQFPRNMFRGSARAFATDTAALAAAKVAIGRGWDLRIDEPARQFFYMPLMHSENLCDQDRCVRLICGRMPEHGAGNMPDARAHREVIRRFGRFPHRNAALGRVSTAPERAFEENGGYGAVLREVREAA